MSIDSDDEILQDFLIEAGEILEQLSEQLVELEHTPRDKELLNAVFRGFHTIKGGASFLNLAALVEVCHKSEDVFNLLRQGERVVDAALMDVILKVLDVVKEMFDQLHAGQSPEAAPRDLISKLVAYLNDAPAAPAAAPVPAPAPVVAAPAAPHAGDSGDITDQEFEQLLDALHGPAGPGAAPAQGSSHGEGIADAGAPRSASDEISEQEFEQLLDQLHGKGGHTGVPKAAATASATPPPPATDVAHEASNSGQKGDEHESAESAKKDSRDGTKDSKAIQGDTTVRVDTSRLDQIMNLVGELVLVRNRLATLEANRADEEMAQAVGNLDVVTADLQAAVMKTRMQPIKKVFGRFPRVVRDLARSLKKEVDLVLRGEDTDLDKNLVEALADPLVHLVRNSVDHGIETPDMREKVGKPRVGRVELAAEQEGDHILLTISDDGAGMDAEVLRKKAVEKGLYDAETAARLDDRECFNIIFLPGFSTKTQISDVSGRGVGMDVVKTRIAQLNGTTEIHSEKGVGSRFLIKVPLTLAIMPTLMVLLRNQIFALPLVNVSEIFHLDLTRTNVVDNQRVVMVREKVLPLFYLGDWLTASGADHHVQTGHVVVVNVGMQRVGFVVDQLIGQEEVVIKPLGEFLQGTAGLAGATIRGDGKIALILDIPGLMKTYAHRL